MGLHPRVRMKKTLNWMERERRENGINIKPNQNRAKGSRRKICPKLNSSIVMNSGTMQRGVHIRKKTRRL